MSRIIELIETKMHVGQGTGESPYRLVSQLFLKDGTLIAEYDPFSLYADFNPEGIHGLSQYEFKKITVESRDGLK